MLHAMFGQSIHYFIKYNQMTAMKNYLVTLIAFGLLIGTACNQSSDSTNTSTDTDAKTAISQKKTEATPTPAATNNANNNLLNAGQNAAKNTLANNNSQPTAAPKPAATAPKGLVNWITLDDLQEKMKSEPKKVIVDLYTNWCGWCKRMDKATFQHAEIANYINDNFYAVKFNAETKDNIKFKDKDYKFVPRGRKGTNELTYRFVLGDKPTGRVGYPTIAFLDEELNRIDAYPGYKDASKFDPLMHFIQENKYKDMTLAEFQKTYTSPIAPTPLKNRNRRNVAAPTIKKNVKLNTRNNAIRVKKKENS